MLECCDTRITVVRARIFTQLFLQQKKIRFTLFQFTVCLNYCSETYNNQYGDLYDIPSAVVLLTVLAYDLFLLVPKPHYLSDMLLSSCNTQNILFPLTQQLECYLHTCSSHVLRCQIETGHIAE